MNAMSLSHSAATEKILANQEEFQNTLAYVCSSQRYYQAYANYFFTQNEWPQPMPSIYTHPLPSEGPSFEPWVMPAESFGIYCRSSMRLIIRFMLSRKISSWIITLRNELFFFPSFRCWQKDGEKLEMWRSRSYFTCILLYIWYFGLVIIWILWL